MLVALPNTQLSHRLYDEGRLFGGLSMRFADMQGDHTTSGLNFATNRPRVEILRDYIVILQELYSPENYYKRIIRTAEQLQPNYKHRLSLSSALKNANAFLKVTLRAGFDKQTGLLYWKTLLKVLASKPLVANVVVTMAALYVHFSKRVTSIVSILEDKIHQIDTVGEDAYNESLINRQPEFS
jgi:hypothetical protein